MKKAIEIKNLIKTYGKARGVSDLSFDVNQGDFFGFIGPNGAGKSTTIRSMLGLIHMNSGSIKVLGMDAVKDHVKILKSIGYMPSETMFYPNMRIGDLLKMTEEAYQKDCREKRNELCERLKVDVTRKIEELSLGNRKKVSIVSTMQHSPELYIFDEPTSGLDPLMQKEFFTLLREENKRGVTIFFSSHILTEIQSYCNKAAIIKEGKLIACDEVSKLSKTNARKITLRECNVIPDLKNINVVYQDSNMISFLYQGEMRELLSYLVEHKQNDVLIEEPSLEEIVLHFYGEESL